MKQLSIKKLGIFFAMALVASTIAVPAQTTTVTTTSSTTIKVASVPAS